MKQKTHHYYKKPRYVPKGKKPSPVDVLWSNLKTLAATINEDFVSAQVEKDNEGMIKYTGYISGYGHISRHTPPEVITALKAEIEQRKNDKW